MSHKRQINLPLGEPCEFCGGPRQEFTRRDAAGNEWKSTGCPLHEDDPKRIEKFREAVKAGASITRSAAESRRERLARQEAEQKKNQPAGKTGSPGSKK